MLTFNSKITASIDVAKTGQVASIEVLQMDMNDLFGSVTRPDKELKAFEKISLKPGETKTVSFDITPEMLEFTGLDMIRKAKKGTFQVMIGGASDTKNIIGFSLK